MPIRCLDDSCAPAWATCCGKKAFCPTGQACLEDARQEARFACHPWNSPELADHLLKGQAAIAAADAFDMELESRLERVEDLKSGCEDRGEACREFGEYTRRLVIWFNQSVLELAPSYFALSEEERASVKVSRGASVDRAEALVERFREIAGPMLPQQ